MSMKVNPDEANEVHDLQSFEDPSQTGFKMMSQTIFLAEELPPSSTCTKITES